MNPASKQLAANRPVRDSLENVFQSLNLDDVDPFTTFNDRSRAFFTSEKDANYNPNFTITPMGEFSRLARMKQWTPDGNPTSTWAQKWQSCFGRPYIGHAQPAWGGNVYFESFRAQGFTPNGRIGLQAEFERLAAHMKWGKTRRPIEREEAFQEEVNGFFDDNATKLESWQQLCREVFVEPVPVSITQCKKVCGCRE